MTLHEACNRRTHRRVSTHRRVLALSATAALGMTIVAGGAATARAVSAEPLYELIDAATERLLTADPVAATKWLNGGPITDPARARQVVDAVTADAAAAQLPTEYVARLFTDQINATEAIQYSRFSWWKLEPSAAPASAPDLSASRALIDGLNRRMVSEIAEQWGVLRSPECALRLAAAKTAVADERRLDPLYRHALDSGTRAYCT